MGWIEEFELLELTENAYKDTGNDRLVVRVNFVHLPTLEVEEQNRSIRQNKFNYDFSRGRSLHFSMKPEELIDRMSRTHIKIGIYRKGDCFPICYTSTHLYGCLCDLVAQTIEEEVPFKLKGPFDLIDPGKSAAGQVDLDIYLSSLGRHSITQYALGADHFLVKKDRCGAEYKCMLDGAREINIVEGRKTNAMDMKNFVKEMAEIGPLAGRLASGRPTKPAQIPLEILMAPPKPSKKKKDRKKKKTKKKK